jgi:hypothetical protein
VVDAIEFGLTGEIARLKGKGTGDIKLATHGPHVDKRDYPDSSLVRLNVHIPSLGKSAVITRNIKKPRELKVEPEDKDVRAILAEVAVHPEVTLSRREIIKFILTEATQRSRDVQTLLKLDEIDQTRSTLKTTQNRLGDAHSAAVTQVSITEDSLRRHLDLPTLSSADVLGVVNKRRAILGLAGIEQLEADTSVSAGIVEAAKRAAPAVNKESALRDLKALRDEVEGGLGKGSKTAIAGAVEGLNKIEADPGLLEAIRRRSFIQTGLDLVDSAQCPLCDTAWEIDALRVHLDEKLKKSRHAEELQQGLLTYGREIAAELARIRALIAPVEKVGTAEGAESFVKALSAWSNDLADFSGKLSAVSDLVSVKARLEARWTAEPATLLEEIAAVSDKVSARPDEAAAVDAQSFLVVAQERLEAWRRASRTEEAAKSAAEVGRAAYRIYCEVAESKLSGLFVEVQGDFSKYYRAINGDDEKEFTAKLLAQDGKLDLTVDFYKRGMFPPGAYHSEGHQDGMGVCLYLALMKRLLGDNFTLAVLDDVVMSVDAGHRKQFCKLLKTHFPDTQFVITTHDRVWAQQMRSEGLVSAKSTVSFYGWTVETGPIVEEVAEIWEEIAADLAKGRVSDAAGKLRRHLEYCASDLADQLGAKITHRADGSNELGDFLPAVLARQNELLGKAAKSAQDWGVEEAKERVKQRKESLSRYTAASNVEKWAVNAVVHYNAWANLSKEDFEPVANTFKALLGEFRCSACDSWLQVSPRRGEPEMLLCTCNAISFNLKGKPK